MMSRRQHKARFAENRGDDTVTGRPQQGSTKAPAFSVPRERFTPPPPTEKKPAVFCREGEHRRREDRTGSAPATTGSWTNRPRQPFGQRSYRAALGAVDAAASRTERSTTVTSSGSVVAAAAAASASAAEAAALSDGGLIAPRGGNAPTKRRLGSITPGGGLPLPEEDSLRFEDLLAAWPHGEDGLVASAGGGEGQEKEEDGEAHGREVGYKVAGVYVARAAASPNGLPLPPLYHLLEVAHLQQRRELEERFAAREAKLKEEQDGLRSQLRLLEATTPTAVNTHRAQPDEPANLPDAAGCGDSQNTNSNWAFAARVEDDCGGGGGGGGEATTAGGTVTTIDDKPDNSPVSDAGENTARNDHDDSGKSGTSDSSGTNDAGTIGLKINGGGGGSSSSSSSGTGSNSATPSPISPATRIKAARKAVGVSLDELVASGEKLERMRKEADQARRRVRSLISQTSDDGGGAAGGPGWGSTVGFLQANSAGWRKLSAEAKARILSMIDRELGLAQLSEGASTPPGPTNDENIGSGDGSGDVVGGDGGREVAAFAREGEVGLLLRECSGAPAIAAVVAGNEEGRRAELDAAKERLRLTIEQLSTYKALEADATSRAAEAEGAADRLRVQLEARERQIEELREISQGNLVRAQRRREAAGLGGGEPGV